MTTSQPAEAQQGRQVAEHPGETTGNLAESTGQVPSGVQPQVEATGQVPAGGQVSAGQGPTGRPGVPGGAGHTYRSALAPPSSQVLVTGTALATPAQVFVARAAVVTARAASATSPSAATTASALAPPMPPAAPENLDDRDLSNRDPESPAAERLRPLRLHAHTATDDALSVVGPSLPVSGLILGRNVNKDLVSLPLFRAEPTDATLIGGDWITTLLAFRALALGARVFVRTANPVRLQGFGEWATGGSGRVILLESGQQVRYTATARGPALHIHDADLGTLPAGRWLGRWQTRISVVRQFTEERVETVVGTDVTLLQRLTSAEATILGAALGLRSETVRRLTMLDRDMLAVIGHGRMWYVWLALSGIEQQFGAPGRGGIA